MSKIFNFAMAAAMAATALAATQMSPAQAHPHYSHGHAHMTCNYVYVSGSGAYLQHNPTLHSRRYRTAPHGEQFMVVKNSAGHAHHTNGWYLVKSKHGYRYWAHRSVLSCSDGSSYKAKHHAKHKDTNCTTAMVSASYAYGKKYPTLRSHTLRHIPHGESFSVIRDSDGHANYDNGWWFLSNSTGKFWVHDSVLTCASESSSNPAPKKVVATTSTPAPKKVEVKKFVYKSGVDGCLQKLECAANKATSDLVKKQVTELKTKIDDMLKNPLLKMGAGPACDAAVEQVKGMGLDPSC